MLRLIFWLIIIYLAYRLFKNMFAGNSGFGGQGNKNESDIHGKGTANPPLDLSNMDIEDAHYVDLDEEKKKEDSAR